ncbi:MAG: hypothetical protein AB1391_00915 [Candidatus Micrarchaeota archaeon]
MVCYILSVICAVFVYAIRKRVRNPELRSLNLMLFGGAIFGFVDHLWNGELFASADIFNDLLLGIAIVSSIFGIWAVVVYTTSLKKLNKIPL